MSEWISVEERLPGYDEIVIVHCRDGFIYSASLCGDRFFFDNDSWCVDIEGVTHWMPLPPEPPKED